MMKETARVHVSDCIRESPTMPTNAQNRPNYNNGNWQYPLTVSQALVVLLVIIQAITFWWVQDVTVRLRQVEGDLIKLKTSIEAVQPYASADRILLTQLSTMVNTLNSAMGTATGLIRDMSESITTLSKGQIDFRVRLEEQLQRQESKRR